MKPSTETPEQKRQREATESIAKNLQQLATSVQALLKGPLKRKTLLVLLSNSCGLGQGSVEAVLTALESLEKDWLQK